jgi:hypothetical protein
VWFEEGDGAALLEGDEVLAVIPGWSGEGGFQGYARDCTGHSKLCWELGDWGPDNAMVQRLRSAADFWSAWDKSPTPWEQVSDAIIDSVGKGVGPHQKYYAIDGNEWPPKALMQIPVRGGTALVTVGVCLRPQPNVERYMEDPSPCRRIELGICVDESFDQSQIDAIASYTSTETTRPWDQFTWLGLGHTIACNFIPGFPAVILHTAPAGMPPIKLPAFRGDPVNLLWMIPITESELTFSMQKGGKALLKLLDWRKVHWMHRTRSSVV